MSQQTETINNGYLYDTPILFSKHFGKGVKMLQRSETAFPGADISGYTSSLFLGTVSKSFKLCISHAFRAALNKKVQKYKNSGLTDPIRLHAYAYAGRRGEGYEGGTATNQRVVPASGMKFIPFR